MCFLVDLKAALLAEARPRGKAFQKLDLPKKSRGMHGTALRRPHSPMDTAADTAADTDTAADSAGTRSHRGRDSDSVAPRSGLGLGRTAVGTRTRSQSEVKWVRARAVPLRGRTT